MKYTNHTNIPLPLAVMLATDTYDNVADPEYISATGLLRPLRGIALSRRLDTDREVDISTLIASKVGTAVHDSVEKAWTPNKLIAALIALGYNEEFINRIHINDFAEVLPPNAIPVFLEHRKIKELNGMKIGGKFDFVLNGRLRDLKTTKTYTYIKDSNADSYIKQGSIYRWLNPEIIKDDILNIDYLFTDFSPVRALVDNDYPKSQILSKEYPLMSLIETEEFLRDMIQKIKYLDTMPQNALPECSGDELWQEKTIHKYYANPAKTARATKNFDDLQEAHTYMVDKGNKGLIKTIAGEVKRCVYCNARPVCTQAENFEASGLLKPL